MKREKWSSRAPICVFLVLDMCATLDFCLTLDLCVRHFSFDNLDFLNFITFVLMHRIRCISYESIITHTHIGVILLFLHRSEASTIETHRLESQIDRFSPFCPSEA